MQLSYAREGLVFLRAASFSTLMARWKMVLSLVSLYVNTSVRWFDGKLTTYNLHVVFSPAMYENKAGEKF
jgi:hypothetical protein